MNANAGASEEVLPRRAPVGQAFEGPRAQRRIFLDSVYTLNNDYFRGWYQGAREAARELNMEYNFAVNEFDVGQLREVVSSALGMGVEGISLLPTTESASPEIILLAGRLGMVVSSNWSNAPWSTPLDVGDHYISYQAANNVAGFRELSRLVFTELGGTGKVIHITGVPGNSSSEERTHGVDEALAEFAGIELVAREPGFYSRFGTQRVIEELLGRHGRVDAVICANDDSALAVSEALRERRYDALVAGSNATDEFLDAMRVGKTFATYAHHGGWIGAFSAVRVFDALNGWTPTIPERMMYFGGFILETAEAAAAYQSLMYRHDRFPFEYERWSRVLHPDDWDPQNPLTPMDPAQHWAWREGEKPATYALPAAYTQPEAGAERDRVAALYRDHVRTDPWREVRALTKHGGRNIV
jgi:ribose transport system substrate-binding protein